MTQQDDGVRDIGSPFRMFSPGEPAAVFDVDFHPQVVRSEEIHPSEVQEDPKDEESSSALESAEGSSTAEKSPSSEGPEKPAPVEKELTQVPGLEDLGSPDETSPGDDVPPAPTPPQPPATTRSSRSAGKSS